MFKVFTLLLYFLKEVIFDNKDEYNFKSSKFNVRKFIILMLVVFSLLAAFTMTSRTYALAKTNIELNKKLTTECKKYDSAPSDEKKSKLSH